ncbi:thioredoxin family protein [candidate division KSB1 bacterium]|nr:thioredoxin family protein [candidate division KSB1 bacterium]
MAFLKEKDAETLRKRFEKLDKPVTIINFTQEIECMYCRETRLLLEEVAALSGKIELKLYNFQLDKEISDQYNIDKIPATVVMADKDMGIRFYGIPGGYEFASLLESIEIVSSGKSPLSPDTLKKLGEIDKDVHIQVFVTPTCPYCPAAVITGHALAHANSRIKADMVEATEFPHLAQKYRVMGVPRVVINENTFFEGALPESAYVEKVIEVVIQKQ